MYKLRHKQISAIAILSGAALLMGGLSSCSKTQTAQALVAEAQQYQQKGDLKAAIIQLKNVLQKNPDDAEARYLLGTIYYETGDPKSAEKELRRALSLGMSPDKVLPRLREDLARPGPVPESSG